MICTTRSSENPSRNAWARIAPLISTTSTMVSRTTKSMRRCSGVASVVSARACSVSRPAELSAPTADARWRAVPATQWLPERSRSPGVLTTGSDSPVSSDSSASARPVSTGPSTTTCSPARTTSTSPATTSAAGTRCSAPSRTTVTSAASSSCSRSSFRLARISCTAPTTALTRPSPTLVRASP